LINDSLVILTIPIVGDRKISALCLTVLCFGVCNFVRHSLFHSRHWFNVGHAAYKPYRPPTMDYATAKGQIFDW